jgi:hypothetical protein
LKSLGLKEYQIILEKAAPHSVAIFIEKEGVKRQIFDKEGD